MRSSAWETRRLKPAGVAALSLLAMAPLVGCSDRTQNASGAGKPLVVCTTTMIGDLARQIGGEHVHVVGIMRAGVDPHIYDPTPDDSIWFRKADLVLVNGLHLEGKMIDMIERVGSKAVALGEHPEITLRRSAAAGAPDPHVWWNVAYFRVFAGRVRDELQRIDPAHAEDYAARADAYLRRLDALHAAVREGVQTIPASARLMITSHDAFFYYGEAYGLQVDAVLGISTDAQAQAGEPDRLARMASQRDVPAIFHETSVSAALNELVDRTCELARRKYQHELKVAGPLYSDSLGEPDSGAGTYIDAVRANTRMVVEALGGTVTPELTAAGE